MAELNWTPLPEVPEERVIFDRDVEFVGGDVRLAIAIWLRSAAQARSGGSYAAQMRIAANEVMKLALPTPGVAPSPAPSLTDGEIDRIWRDTPAQGDPTGKLFYRYFARAVEARVLGVPAADANNGLPEPRCMPPMPAVKPPRATGVQPSQAQSTFDEQVQRAGERLSKLSERERSYLVLQGPTSGVPACGERHVDVDVALLRSAESDLRHVVEANPPGYRERSLESALRSLQAFMRANGVARNVGGVLVSDPPTAGGVREGGE